MLMLVTSKPLQTASSTLNKELTLIVLNRPGLKFSKDHVPLQMDARLNLTSIMRELRLMVDYLMET